MLKGFKYRIYPNSEQIKMIEQTFGCCRLVYNLALQVKITAYTDAGINLSSFDLCYQLAEMKQDYDWLTEVNSQSLQVSVKKVDVAFMNFFNGNGYPKFESKNSKQSFQCPGNKREINFEKGLLTLPKIKNIPIVISRRFTGKIKTVTISKVCTGKYFASVLVENNVNEPIKPIIKDRQTLGIDLGIKFFAILSDGTKIENPKYLKNHLNRLKYLNRIASRKKKGSSNRKKAVKRLSNYNEYISNMRNDFLHKLSTKLVCDSQETTFCIEDLAISNMIKNHKLSQSISDVSWGEFIRQLKYKCNWVGKNLVVIGRFEPSSKLCNNCNAVNNLLTLMDREWVCASCGSFHDRDTNAAINIKNIGLRNSGKGIPGEPVEFPTFVGAVKQEKVTKGTSVG